MVPRSFFLFLLALETLPLKKNLLFYLCCGLGAGRGDTYPTKVEMKIK